MSMFMIDTYNFHRVPFGTTYNRRRKLNLSVI